MEMRLRLSSWLLHMLLKFLAPVFWFINRSEPRKIPASNDPILNLTAIELAKKIRNRQISSECVVKSFIQRIKEVNPIINAVIEDRFDAALEEARDCDKMLKTGEMTLPEIARKKPLFGVPITVKESCGLQGLSQTGCTIVRRGIKADADSLIVEKMRKAGAIPLCVTNTPEICSGFESTNLLYGTTSNPYDERHSAGGSSSGEGALIGAGASLIGIGSDIAGSIRIPALFNGIFGHKPTSGIIPIEGHYPMSLDPLFQKFLVLGPMARYAEDLHLAVKIMSSGCKENLQLDNPFDISKLKVYAISECDQSFGIIPTNDDVKNAIDRAAKHFESSGAQVTYPIIGNLDETLEIALTTFFGIRDIPPILVNPKDQKKSANSSLELFKSLLGISQYTRSAILMSIVRDLNGLVRLSEAPKYQQKGELLRKHLIELLADDGVLFYPTFTGAAPLFGQTVLLTTASLYCLICNCLGFPSTHVPMGLNADRMPIGFQVIAAPNQDRLCLAVAIELEKAFGGWVAPPTSK